MGEKYLIIWCECIDSTNNAARKMLEDIDIMSVVAAGFQTAGRGQKGNVWSSEAGKNLTFSIAVRFGSGEFPALPAVRQFAVSEAAALAIVSFLAEEGIKAMIKWPNDIYVGDRKICGMLIEQKVRGGMLEGSVIGIGLDVNQTDFPPELPNPVSMTLLTGKEYPLEESLERIAGIFHRILSEALSSGQALSSLEERYVSKLYRRDELHRFIDCRSGEEFEGLIRGIDGNACLLVDRPDKGRQSFAFKEISYVL